MLLCSIFLVAAAFPTVAEENTGQPEGTQPILISAAITDCGAVMNGERKRSGLSVRPFLEDWTGFVAVKNTGTTFIDHFRISFSCPMKGSDAMKIDLVSPDIPAWLWKPFAGDMISLCTRGMDFVFTGGEVKMLDAATGNPITVSGVYPSQPLKPEGLPPGETVLVEYTEPYSACIEGFVHSIAARKHMDIRTEIMDRENNVMHMIARNYTIVFLTFDQIIAAITFKGKGEHGACSLELTIDDQLYDSIPWVAYEWK
ncbi:MAG: hypothetical protein AB1724_00655 [Thermodesulfobacteriota bacterium]